MTEARFVLVAHVGHADPTTGGGQRTHLLFEAMREAGPTDVALIGPDPDPARDLAALFPGARGVHHRGTLRGVRRILTGRRPDRGMQAWLLGLLGPGPAVAVLRYLEIARKTGLTEVRRDGVRVAVDVDDRDDVMLANLIAERGLLSRLVRAPKLRGVRRRLLADLAGAARVFVVTPEDAEGLPPGLARVIPNVPFSEPADPPPASLGRDVIFVGSFAWPPNGEALAWTLAEVWPRLAPAFPESRLRVVGREVPAELRALCEAAPRVTVVENAPDLAPHYAAARVAIAPLSLGAGSKIKVIEGCAWGRPVVVRAHAARGFGPEIAARLAIARDGPTFAEAVARYLGDPALADRDGAALRALQAEGFGRAAVRARLATELRALAREAAGQGTGAGRGMAADQATEARR